VSSGLRSRPFPSVPCRPQPRNCFRAWQGTKPAPASTAASPLPHLFLMSSLPQTAISPPAAALMRPSWRRRCASRLTSPPCPNPLLSTVHTHPVPPPPACFVVCQPSLFCSQRGKVAQHAPPCVVAGCKRPTPQPCSDPSGERTGRAYPTHPPTHPEQTLSAPFCYEALSRFSQCQPGLCIAWDALLWPPRPPLQEGGERRVWRCAAARPLGNPRSSAAGGARTRQQRNALLHVTIC
jgi:hypothetical protein